MGCFCKCRAHLTSLVDACRGLPLGLMRSSRYTLHRRSWHEPFDLQFRSDSGSALTMQVRHH
jgi:hypothetical protein